MLRHSLIVIFALGAAVQTTAVKAQDVAAQSPDAKRADVTGVLTKNGNFFHLEVKSGACAGQRLGLTPTSEPIRAQLESFVEGLQGTLLGPQPAGAPVVVEITGTYLTPTRIDVTGVNTPIFPVPKNSARIVYESGLGSVARKGSEFTITLVNQGPIVAPAPGSAPAKATVYTVVSPSDADKAVLEEAASSGKFVDFNSFSRLPMTEVPIEKINLTSISLHTGAIPLMATAPAASPAAAASPATPDASSLLGTVTKSGDKLIFTVAQDPTPDAKPATYDVSATGATLDTLEKLAGTGAPVSITGTVSAGGIDVSTATTAAAAPRTLTPPKSVGLTNALGGSVQK
jgi:hypothetical protein